MDMMGDSSPAAHRSWAGEAALFAVCLVVAITIWLFYALNESYEQEIEVQLTYSLPTDLTTTKPLPKTAEILVGTSGWQLIRERFRKHRLQLDISGFEDEQLLITNGHLGLFAGDLPSNMHVIQVHPDTIDLRLEHLVTKQIPITLNADFLDRTDVIADSIYVYPDSLLVSGPESLLKEIDGWSTEPVTGNNDTLCTGMTPLPFPAVGSVRISTILVSWYAHLSPTVTANAYMTIAAPDQSGEVDLRIQYSSLPEMVSSIRASDFSINFEKTGDGTQYHVVAQAKRDKVHTIGVFPSFIPRTASHD